MFLWYFLNCIAWEEQIYEICLSTPSASEPVDLFEQSQP